MSGMRISMSESPFAGATLHPGFRAAVVPTGWTIAPRSMIFRCERGHAGVAGPARAAEPASARADGTRPSLIPKSVKRNLFLSASLALKRQVDQPDILPERNGWNH